MNFVNYYQVLIITGGQTGTAHSRRRLDTTEVYNKDHWRTVSGKLPMQIYIMEMSTISNRIFLFGVKHLCIILICFRFQVFLGGSILDKIIEYNPKSEEWQDVGAMKEARYHHAVSPVSFEDYADWCE